MIADDPVQAEVLSKTLFLEGRRAISAAATRLRASVLWVGSDGSTGETPSFSAHVVWRAA